MTVKELIEELQKLDPYLMVWTHNEEEGWYILNDVNVLNARYNKVVDSFVELT